MRRAVAAADVDRRDEEPLDAQRVQAGAAPDDVQDGVHRTYLMEVHRLWWLVVLQPFDIGQHLESMDRPRLHVLR